MRKIYQRKTTKQGKIPKITKLNNNGVVDKQADELTEGDKELERLFKIQI